jgi:hypothetical protein
LTAALILYDTAGVPWWDSDSAAGGVFADVKTYLAADTATLTYPAFAGRSVVIVPLLIWNEAGTIGVTADTALGYPRVTVVAAGSTRRFAIEVF